MNQWKAKINGNKSDGFKTYLKPNEENKALADTFTNRNIKFRVLNLVRRKEQLTRNKNLRDERNSIFSSTSGFGRMSGFINKPGNTYILH